MRLVERSYCKHQYVSSAFNFNSVFRINKSDIKTNANSFGAGWHFSSTCCHPTNPYFYLPGQHIEQVLCNKNV